MSPTTSYLGAGEPMLCMNSYPKAYVDECRSRLDAQLAAYSTLVATAREHAGDGGGVETAIDGFEPVFFNNLVLALEASFMHRSRALEKKDGNALNEVRMLSASLLEHGGRFTADRSIKYNPEKSVLRLQFGDEIRLTEDAFTTLADAFFDEIDAKFAEAVPV